MPGACDPLADHLGRGVDQDRHQPASVIRRDHLLRGVGEVLGGQNRQPRSPQDALAELDIGAFETNDERDVQIDLARRRHDALGDDVAAHDPTEDVDQDPLDVRVAQDQLERCRHRSLVRTPPTSRKFAGLTAVDRMMSIVAIARPAPLTMHLILPSSLIS